MEYNQRTNVSRRVYVHVAFEAPGEHANSTRKGQEWSPEPLCDDANICPHVTAKRIISKNSCQVKHLTKSTQINPSATQQNGSWSCFFFPLLHLSDNRRTHLRSLRRISNDLVWWSTGEGSRSSGWYPGSAFLPHRFQALEGKSASVGGSRVSPYHTTLTATDHLTIPAEWPRKLVMNNRQFPVWENSLDLLDVESSCEIAALFYCFQRWEPTGDSCTFCFHRRPNNPLVEVNCFINSCFHVAA